MARATNSEQVLDALKGILGKYGLSYKDDSDEDIPRKIIQRDGKEVARVTFVSPGRLEIMVFNRNERTVINDIAEDVRDKFDGLTYKFTRGY
ncbi:MAG: hypothetical protein AABW58_03735 [Nanoarchaeota archaeon]